MIDFTKADAFDFWVPLRISKSKEGDKEGRRLIEGIASTDDEDLQREVVIQNGIDFSYFLKYGYYNNDHKPGFDNKVGQPLECKVTKAGLWTKGFLFKEHKVANDIWELANSLEASDADRKLGFSIQGKVTRRNGRRLVKSWVQDIAITAAPINTNTWLDVVKGLSALEDDYWCTDDECFYLSPRLISPTYKSACGNSCVRSMENAIDSSKMDLRKDVVECSCGKKHEKEDDEEKAFTQANQGKVTTPESLEGGVKDLNWADVERKYAKKSLHFNECVEFLREVGHLAPPDARVVAEAVFGMNGQ